jgi:hypothetical protein
LATATVSLDRSTETGRIASWHDKWGRTVSHTDSDGAVTTASNDTAGEPIGLTYSGQITTIDGGGQPVAGTGPWLSWIQDHDVVGRVGPKGFSQGVLAPFSHS